MSDTRYSQALGSPTLTFARCNRDTFARLPDPDADPWTASETFENPKIVTKLRRIGIISQTGDRVLNDQGHRVRTYRTNREPFAALDSHGLLDIDRPPAYGTTDISCPECGRVSFVNVDGERLRCKQCDHTAPKGDWR